MKQKGGTLSVRSRYRVSMGLVFLAMAAAMLVSGMLNYRSQYAARLESARNDFQTAWREIGAFTNRISGLANIVQYNSSLVRLLENAEEYTPETYQRARTDLIPMIYSLEDGSGDYACRIYIPSSLPVLDSSSYVLPLNDLKGLDWAEASMEGFGTARWVAGEGIPEGNAVFLAPIRSLEHKTRLIAMLRIDVRKEALLARMSPIQSGDYAGCLLATAEGRAVVSAGSGQAGRDDPAAGLEDRALSAYTWNEKETEQGTAFYRRLERNDWLLSMTVWRDLLRGMILPNNLIIHVASVLLFVMGALLAAPPLWRVIGRIERFSKHVQQYNEPHSDPRDRSTLPEPLDPGAMDEVGRLISAYNDMVARIDRLMREQEIREEESRRLEIQALQNQINPHFLYNSLDAVRWMARMEQPDEIEAMIQNLSDFYRLCLSSGRDVLTVAQETEICRHYFRIMCLRSHRNYRLEVHLPEEALPLHLPKITLQPLVENAIVHGLMESEAGEGTVWINGERKKDRLLLSVEDSGGRFRPGDWERILRGDGPHPDRPHGGYGLWNVERRLCLFYGRDSVLRLSPSDTGRTRIEWELPTEAGLPLPSGEKTGSDSDREPC